MKQSIKERVHALRMTFHPNSIKAFIIPSTDPHLSEYVAPHWMLTAKFEITKTSAAKISPELSFLQSEIAS